VDVEAGRDILKSALETFDVGIELTDVVLKPFDPAFLLGNTLATFLLAIVDKFRKFVGQPFILHVIDVGEGGADGSDDGGGEGLCM